MPYFVFLEFLGPGVETVGTALTIVAFLVGDLSAASFLAFLVFGVPGGDTRSWRTSATARSTTCGG